MPEISFDISMVSINSMLRRRMELDLLEVEGFSILNKNVFILIRLLNIKSKRSACPSGGVVD